MPVRLLLKGVKRKVGVIPGPMLAMTYRPKMVPRAFPKDYLMRGMSGQGAWSKSEAELFAAFVSNLNTCHF